MNSGSVLRHDLPGDPGQRVVLRAHPSAVPTGPAPAGMWITEQDLATLKRQWTEQARDQGREQGRQDAHEDAQRKAEAEAKLWLERELKARDEKSAKVQAEKWRGLATALAEQLGSLREELQAQVSEWSFIAVTRLLGETSRERVVAAVKHVLAEAQLDGPTTVLVNAEDLVLIEADREMATSAWPDHLTFAASDRVGLGGCLILSPVQTLDARLEVQLALLREALDSARHSREAAQGE